MQAFSTFNIPGPIRIVNANRTQQSAHPVTDDYNNAGDLYDDMVISPSGSGGIHDHSLIKNSARPNPVVSIGHNSPPAHPFDDVQLLYHVDVGDPTSELREGNEQISALTAEAKVEKVQLPQSPLESESDLPDSTLPLGSAAGSSPAPPSLPGRIMELFTRFSSVYSGDILPGNRLNPPRHHGSYPPTFPDSHLNFQRASCSPQYSHGLINNGDTMGDPFTHCVSCPIVGNSAVQFSQPDYPPPSVSTTSSIPKRANVWPDPCSKRCRLL